MRGLAQLGASSYALGPPALSGILSGWGHYVVRASFSTIWAWQQKRLVHDRRLMFCGCHAPVSQPSMSAGTRPRPRCRFSGGVPLHEHCAWSLPHCWAPAQRQQLLYSAPKAADELRRGGPYLILLVSLHSPRDRRAAETLEDIADDTRLKFQTKYLFTTLRVSSGVSSKRRATYI